MSPKVTVIIPVYNVESYLREAVDSVLCQTLQNIEVILVDDGSTDNSGIICDEYAAADERVKVVHKQNEGQSVARNIGIEIAHGEYLMFLDSDDLYAQNNLLENLTTLFDESEDIDFIQFKSFNFKNTPRREGNNASQQSLSKISGKNNIFKAFENWSICHIVWDKIYKTEAIKNAEKFPKNLYYEDEYFICNLLPNIKTVILSDLVGYYVRERKGSTTRPLKFNNRLFYDHVIVYAQLISVGSKYGEYGLVRTYFNASLINYKAAILHGWNDTETIDAVDSIMRRNAVPLKYLVKEKAPLKEILTILVIKLFGIKVMNPFLKIMGLLKNSER